MTVHLWVVIVSVIIGIITTYVYIQEQKRSYLSVFGPVDIYFGVFVGAAITICVGLILEGLTYIHLV